MDELELFRGLGISLLLGLLVGLQREHAHSALAGLRTFPLITVLGSLCAILAEPFGGWIVAAGLLAVAASLAIGNWQKVRGGQFDPGMTTEVAALVMFAVGAYLVVGLTQVAVAVAVGVAVLLHFKGEMHGITAKLGDQDLRAIMQFALITFVVLPILPDQTYGPLEVLNPFQIWLMVVLIVGISLAGYIVYKFFGERVGALLGGVLGGAISSTATVVSYARRTAHDAAGAALATLVILIASTVVFVRVAIEISVVSPALLRAAAAPLTVMAVATLLPGVLLWLRVKDSGGRMPEQKNPTEMQSAIVFAALYALVLLALKATKIYIGDQGLYLVAALSGLTDLDAITLSTARMVQTGEDGGLSAGQGWRLVVVAAMANMVFKAGVVSAIGHRALLKLVVLCWLLPMTVGIALVLLWPG